MCIRDRFVALPGAKTDGSLYIDEALDKGAAAVVCRRRPQREGVFFTTPDPRRALALLAENWFGHPEMCIRDSTSPA